MISEGKFKQMYGGLYAAVLQYDNDNLAARTMLRRALRDAMKYEASVHGAKFDRKGFGKVMQALVGKDITADFYVAAWNICEPVVLGVQIKCDTLFVKRQGKKLKVGRGKFTEDLCLSRDATRSIVEDKPHGAFFSRDIGLAEHFDTESMQDMADNDNTGRWGEVDPKNTRITRMLDGQGVTIGQPHNSGVFELRGLTPALDNLWKPTVIVHEVYLEDGRVDPNNFYVEWPRADGEQQIIVTYSKTISTFTGEPIIRGQIVSNGNLPPEAELACIMAAMFEAGDGIVSKRHWGEPAALLQQCDFSPSIPLLGTRHEVQAALVDACGNEILSTRKRLSDVQKIFGGSIPVERFHVTDEPEIVNVLCKYGVSRRKLGDCFMQPATIDLESIRLETSQRIKASTSHYDPERPSVADNTNEAARFAA